MIKITVEIWPYGSETAKYKIAEGVVYNDGTGDYETGNYKGNFITYGRDNNKYQTVVKNFKRVNDVWQLLSTALTNNSPVNKVEEKLKRAFKLPVFEEQ